MNDTPNEPNNLESPGPRQAVSIIVPTFREAANIPRLAERIHAALSDSGISWELLLVDRRLGRRQRGGGRGTGGSPAGAHGDTPPTAPGTCPSPLSRESGCAGSTAWW